MTSMRIDGKRWISMPVAVLVWLVSATISAALAWGAMQSDQKMAKATMDDHTVRIQKIETKIEDIREMKNDISWIKRTMERERQQGRGQ